MKLVLLVAMFLFGVSLSVSAEAKGTCAKGDDQVGPNCVHTDDTPMPQQAQPFATVYRMSKGKKVVVWKGFAIVVRASEEKLIVSEWSAHERTGATGFWTVEYTWDGRTYSSRKQID